MIFTAPLALLALALLPPLYFLLRLIPPSPRRLRFPPLAFLRDLGAAPPSPQRLPLWLLLLRLAALACLILGFAGPTLNPPPALPGAGPILLVIDNGWASAIRWPAIIDTARQIASAAQLQHRGVAILATARPASNATPQLQGVFDAATAQQIITAMQPEPWPADPVGATQALQSAREQTRFYLADGITDAPGFKPFLASLHPTRIYAPPTAPPLLGPPALAPNGRITLHATGITLGQMLLAESAEGHLLASVPFDGAGNATLTLPAALRRKIARFTLAGPRTAGGTAYTDSTTQAVSAGLAAGSADASSPFLGSLYYLWRALPDSAEIITGSFATVLASAPGIMILADQPLNAAEQQAASLYMRNGGILIRFAGPLTADAPDPLAVDPLLRGDRRLGGALTWTAPEPLAPFPPDSPFAGIALDPRVTVSQQIIADPTSLEPQTIWAALADGTPLILGRAIGQGYLVNVLTSANTGWSNLALSGIFPVMLGRLTSLSRGTATRPDQTLPLQLAMNGFGTLSTATNPAAITPNQSRDVLISPSQPPGIYGAGAIALNLGGHLPPVEPASLPGALPFGAPSPSITWGPALITAALLLLSLDALAALLLRGTLTRRAALLALALAAPLHAKAQTAALQTQLGYLITNNPELDQLSADGLGYVSANTSAHTSVQLGPPVALTAGTDDLAFYPLIYWPLAPSTASPTPAACAALTAYMAHGGLLVIDMPGGDADAQGSGAGFAPGAAATFARDTACLDLPPLQPLTSADVLAHSFYILQDFPGHFTGAPVLAAIPAARDADGVTPVIVGQNFWAGAWARDAAGGPEQTPIPGADNQRILADRFGVNLVIYALTGSYKADQNAAPLLLDRLGP